jgi:uncharacterized protein YecE (DUF72 family)
MPAYIANHEKKNRIFAKRERELIHAVKNDLPSKEVSSRAESVREAKMSVFKCRFAKSTSLQPHAFSPEELAAVDEEVRKWWSMSTAEIIEMYRPKESRRPT